MPGEHKSAFAVDACPIFIHGLSIWLVPAGYEICGQAADTVAIDASIAGCTANPLLCFIGPNIRTRHAFIACRRIRALVSSSHIVFISSHANDATFREDVADAGALACLPVEVTEEVLLSILPPVLAGQSLMALNPDTPRVQPLSERELDVLRLSEAGMTNPQIADALHLGRKTVDKHVQHIFGKLCVNSRQDAVHRAYHRGLL